MALRVGCTGWGYDDWRGGFYPAGTPASEFLSRYARVFDCVEVDSTYYRVPSAAQVTRWVEATPPGFTFAVKLPGSITHEARLRDVEAPLAHFLDVMAPLARAGRLGPLVVQLPAQFRRDSDERALHAFLATLPARHRWAVELRHDSWWHADTFDALRAAGAALVWSVNQYATAPPETTADFVVARFVGDRQLTRFTHVQRDLTHEMAPWVERLQAAKRAGDVFAMVNNHFMGFAPKTAVLLQGLLAVPQADLTKASRDGGQRGLADYR